MVCTVCVLLWCFCTGSASVCMTYYLYTLPTNIQIKCVAHVILYPDDVCDLILILVVLSIIYNILLYDIIIGKGLAHVPCAQTFPN